MGHRAVSGEPRTWTHSKSGGPDVDENPTHTTARPAYWASDGVRVRGELTTAFTDVADPRHRPPGGCAFPGAPQVWRPRWCRVLSRQAASDHACCPHRVRRNAASGKHTDREVSAGVHLCLQGRGGHRCSLSRHPWTRVRICR
jgi:hypothetical protein